MPWRSSNVRARPLRHCTTCALPHTRPRPLPPLALPLQERSYDGAPPPPPPPRGPPLCRYWHERGSCRHGDQCIFVHGERARRLEVSEADSAPAVN